jgi:hypothetical protein
MEEKEAKDKAGWPASEPTTSIEPGKTKPPLRGWKA